MSYRRMARVSKSESTRFGGPAVGVVAQPSVSELADAQPEYFSATIWGVCSGCGATSDNMESDGWITPDNYRTYLCPTCQFGEKCRHCGLTMKVTKTQPGSLYRTRSYFRIGQFVAECTNPDCCNRGYLFGVYPEEVNPNA